MSLLQPVLRRVAGELWGHDITLVDSAAAMAEAAARELERRGLLRPPTDAADADPDAATGRRATDRLRCFVTDEARVAEVAARFLGRAPERNELCDGPVADGTVCTDFDGHEGGPLQCSSDCRDYDLNSCDTCSDTLDFCDSDDDCCAGLTCSQNVEFCS